MSKIALLGDVHFDAKVSSMVFLQHQERFFTEQFIPYLVENKIKKVFQLGDLFDRRTNINVRILHHAKRVFFTPLAELGVEITGLVGNHDMFYLDSLVINSPNELIGHFPNIKFYTEPSTVIVDDVKFDLIPWICKENFQQVNDFIKASTSDYCLGHFEISGFHMYRGHKAQEGLSPSLFKKYKHVWSGHFHTRSTAGNISYIGTPTEITWQDCDDPRGFEVFDTETLQTEFIKNKFSLFQKIPYNEEVFDAGKFDYKSLKDKYVKVIVVKKTNMKKYDNFLQQVYDSGCNDIAIEENFEEFTKGTVNESIKVEDTTQVMKSYVDSIDTGELDKNKLKDLLLRLYVEAINSEV